MREIYVDSLTINMEEPLLFRLTIDSKVNLSESVLRVAVCSKEGAIVGIAYSQLFSLKKSDSNVINFSFNTDNLAPGSYVVDLILCSYENGIQIRQDILGNVFDFSVLETKVLYNMQWKKANWGNIIFDEIKVIQND